MRSRLEPPYRATSCRKSRLPILPARLTNELTCPGERGCFLGQRVRLWLCAITDCPIRLIRPSRCLSSRPLHLPPRDRPRRAGLLPSPLTAKISLAYGAECSLHCAGLSERHRSSAVPARRPRGRQPRGEHVRGLAEGTSAVAAKLSSLPTLQHKSQ